MYSCIRIKEFVVVVTIIWLETWRVFVGFFFGFIEIWVAMMVHVEWRSFLLSTGWDPAGLNESIVFVVGTDKASLILLLGKSCSLCQRNSSKK